MIFKARPAEARRGQARRGRERLHVTQYGNWDNFLGRGVARNSAARQGRVRRGSAWRGNTPAGGRYHRTLSVNKNKATKAKQHEANQS